MADEDEPKADGTLPEDERDDVEQVWMLGEGGSVILMDLPLPFEIARRVAKGQIVRVNEDGSPYEPSDDDPALVPETEAERIEREKADALEFSRLKQENPDADPAELAVQADSTAEPVKPKPVEAKGVWVHYAQSQGMSHEDADAMTKAQLIEKFGG